MARDQTDPTFLTSRDDLVAWLEGGCKSEAEFRIGTEHEKFPFRKADLSPIAYDGPAGIRALLEGMQNLLGWEPIADGGRIIGLYDVTGGGAISLEPGGQFELSGAPVETIHQTCSELHAHLAQVREVADPLGVGFLGLGASPKWTLAETPVMPKQRYAIMSRYLPKTGAYGLEMMFRTSTVQVNLDYSSEADMVKKLRVGLALQPVATALFANSPFTEGKPNGFETIRSEWWKDVDNVRAGMLPWAFEDGMGFERYVDYALEIPLYFVKRDERYHDVAGQSFRDLMAGTLPDLPGERATVSDWSNHLTTIFPEVRLKRFIEMRGADSGPTGRICALPSFWVGLLYHQPSLDAAWELVKDWTDEDRQTLRDAVPREGLGAMVAGRSVLEVARDALKLADDGLAARARTNLFGDDERIHLAPIMRVVEENTTLAGKLLARYAGEWNGSVDPIFEEFAY